jgi:hypothetical protein
MSETATYHARILTSPPKTVNATPAISGAAVMDNMYPENLPRI